MLHAFAFTNPAAMLRKVLDVLPFLVLVKRIVCLVSILFLSVTYLQERKVILGLHLYPCGKGKSLEWLLFKHPDMLTTKTQLFSLDYLYNYNFELSGLYFHLRAITVSNSYMFFSLLVHSYTQEF